MVKGGVFVFGVVCILGFFIYSSLSSPPAEDTEEEPVQASWSVWLSLLITVGVASLILLSPTMLRKFLRFVIWYRFERHETITYQASFQQVEHAPTVELAKEALDSSAKGHSEADVEQQADDVKQVARLLEAHANLKIANLRERQSPDLYSDYEDATPAEVQMIPI